MSLLESLFNSEIKESTESPLVKYDRLKQKLRFRLGTDMKELKLLIRHFVQGAGYVSCNEEPYKKKDGGFALGGLYFNPDGTRTPRCVFCSARKELKQEIEEKAMREGRKPSMDEMKPHRDLYPRYIQLIGAAEVEVREGGKVVKPLENKAIAFKASDMFFDQLDQAYKTLYQLYENKGSITRHWLTMDGKGKIMMDDLVSKDEAKRAIEVDLDYFDKQTKSYDEGVKRLSEKAKAVAEATPIEEDPDELPY